MNLTDIVFSSRQNYFFLKTELVDWCRYDLLEWFGGCFFWCVYRFNWPIIPPLPMFSWNSRAVCCVYQVDYWFLSHSQRANSKYRHTCRTLLPIQDMHREYNDSITSSQIFRSVPPTHLEKAPKLRLSGLSDVGRYEGRNFRVVSPRWGKVSGWWVRGRKRRSQDGAWLSEDAVDDMAKVGEISSRQWRCWLLGFLHYWERLDVCMVYPSLKLT